jgi:Flp pilus assembly pilin Flp
MQVRNRRNRKGQALVEYALLIAGVALIAVAAVAIFGHKTSDMIAAVAAVLPGAHGDDNAPIVSGKFIETAPNTNGDIALDTAAIVGNATTPRLGDNVLGAGVAGDGFGGLVVEANP